MTTFLFSTLLTAGSDRMAVTDPHGWTLTVISVCVVFIALIILFCIYGLLGEYFMGTFKRKAKPAGTSTQSTGGDEETAAAIALALDLYIKENLHDEEPGYITIEPRDNSNWKFGKL